LATKKKITLKGSLADKLIECYIDDIVRIIVVHVITTLLAYLKLLNSWCKLAF